MKKYDVFGIGNALVDCVILVTEKFLEENNIEKGVMTLVDDEKQKSIIEKMHRRYNYEKMLIKTLKSILTSVE